LTCALPIFSDGDLVVVWMDFAESEESVAVAAIFYEGRLQGGFYPSDLGEVNVAPQLAAGRRFEIKFLEPVTGGNDNPCFFRVDGIHQHSFGRHSELRAPARRQGGAGRPAHLKWRIAGRIG